MSTLAHFLRPVLAAACFLMSPQQAAAQHVHTGDVIVSVQAGKLCIDSGEEQAGTGYRIFEGSFSTPLGGHRWTTDDPGFDMNPGTLVPGEQLWVRGLGTLRAWNGSAWVASVPQNEFVRVRDSLEELIVFRPSGISVTAPGSTGIVEAADSEGVVHQHIDFFLLNSANDTANSGASVAPGAYLIQMQLFSTAMQGSNLKYMDSDPFYIAFNFGLGDEAFEGAVHALAVPEPTAVLMLLPGLALIAYRCRTRRARKLA